MKTTATSIYGGEILAQEHDTYGVHALHISQRSSTGTTEVSNLYRYEEAKKLHAAIGEVVEKLRPKTKTQYRYVFDILPSPTPWGDCTPRDSLKSVFGRLETREVAA